MAKNSVSQSSMPIEADTAPFKFLSNGHRTNVVLLGLSYETAEHAYQAAKTLDFKEKLLLKRTAAEKAHKLGQSLTLREDWSEVKDEIMLEIIRIKFGWMVHPRLAKKLIATGSRQIRVTTDLYWGVDANSLKGRNQLGKTLMQVREEVLEQQPVFDGYRLDP